MTRSNETRTHTDMNKTLLKLLTAVLGLFVFVGLGCDSDDDLGDAVDSAQDEVSEAGEDLQEGAEEMGDNIQEGAQNAGEEIEEGAENVRDAISD